MPFITLLRKGIIELTKLRPVHIYHLSRSLSFCSSERRCARSGRRKSIEFEDLYADGGSGRLAHAHRVTSASSRGKHPLNRTDNTHNPQPGTTADTKPTRQRKSSDPSSYFRKVDPFYQHHHGPGGNGSGKARGHGVQGHRGIMSVVVSEEDKKMIDEKLSGIGGGDHLGVSPPQQRRRKISSPSKIMSKH